MSETLGLILIRSGVVSREGLYQALEVQRQTGRYLGSCLIALGLVTPDQLRAALSQQLGVGLADGRAVLSAPEALASEVPSEVVERYRVVPYAVEGEILRLAFYEPGTADSLSEISFFTGRQVQAFLCDEAVVERTIGRLYPAHARTMARLPQTSSPPGDGAPAPVQAPASAPAAAHGAPTPPGGPAGSALEVLSPAATTETAMAPVTAQATRAPDRRRPAELIRPVEEISNRDFGRALGLEEPEPEPIPLAQRKRVAVREVRGSSLLSIVEAAEKIFEAEGIVDIAEIAVRFLRSFFDRALAFDLTSSPAHTLVRSGFLLPVESLELGHYPFIVDVIRSGQSFHGSAPQEASWQTLYQELGKTNPGSLLVAPVRDRQHPRLLFYADSTRPEPYEDLHETAVLVREVATALSLLEVS